MSDEQHNRAALENQAFALMGRLHVTLRRQTGRVTDIEYMRIDPGYCRYLLKMASLSTSEDLQDIAAKLQEVFFGEDGLFVRSEPRPLLSRLHDHAEPAPGPTLNSSTLSTAATPGNATSDDQVDRAYIGRLR